MRQRERQRETERETGRDGKTKGERDCRKLVARVSVGARRFSAQCRVGASETPWQFRNRNAIRKSEIRYEETQ